MNDVHANPAHVGPESLEPLLSSLSFDSAVGLISSDGRLITAYGDLDRVFPLASVSKLIATYAALVAIDRGALALDDAAGEETPQGCTVEHLLAHAAGYAFEGGEFLAAPGKRRMYTNAGIEQLGRVVARAVETDFDRWVRESVTEPLGMETVEVAGSPAKDYRASIEDLLVLGREFLTPTLISSELAESAHRPHFPGLSGVLPGYGRQSPNDWGLGVEIKGKKEPHWTGALNSARTFGHFGQSGSFLWVDPEAIPGGLSAAFLSSKPFGEEHAGVWPALNDTLVRAARARS